MNRLTAKDRPALLQLLQAHPAENVFLLSVVARHIKQSILSAEGTFFALPEGGPPRAVVYTTRTGLCVPFTVRREDAVTLGRRLRKLDTPRLLVGPRDAVDGVWEGLKLGVRPRLWRDHRLYTLRRGDLKTAGHQDLRLALPRDLEHAVELAALMQAEELGVNPINVDAARFRRRIATLIARDQLYVLPIGETFGFQASASSSCPEGAQVEAVYTPPRLRGRGYATAGLSSMVTALLEEHPLVTLHVNEGNAPAVKLYERMGFQRDAAFRLVSV